MIRWEGDGYIEYAVLSVGGGSFSGEEYIAVPWETLTISRNMDHFLWNGKEQWLDDTPEFTGYHFYDRSSPTVLQPSRLIPQSTHMWKHKIESIWFGGQGVQGQWTKEVVVP